MDNNYILFKALGLPFHRYSIFFNDILSDIIEKRANDERLRLLFKNDDSSEFCYIETELDKRFPKNIWIKFDDNDFGNNIKAACDSFYSQYADSSNLYSLYARLAGIDTISPEQYIKNYIVQKAYGDYIGNLYCHEEILLAPTAINESIFNYLNEIINVSLVPYLPDEISWCERKFLLATLKGSRYLYEDEFWNNESCFISFSSASQLHVTLL